MSSVASFRCSRTKRHDYAVLRLTSATQAGEAFGFVVIVFTFLFSYYLFQNLLQQECGRESDSYGNEECRPISEMKSRKRL